ncbi:hypothetical protein D3C87_1883790 [compost metagenome]
MIEQHQKSGGLGLDVLEAIRDLEGIQIEFACLPDEFLRGYGSYEDHLRQIGLDASGIIHTIESRFKRANRHAAPLS